MRKKAVGIICEFNPLHNGHIYFINKVKEIYPDRAVVLVLNSYFLQRGEASIISKENRVRLSLKYGVDLVLEQPVFFGTQSADTFAESAVKLLESMYVDTLVFGSECNDKVILENIADKQLNDPDFDNLIKVNLKKGDNYPTAVAKACETSNFEYNPNDILGICYIKAIKKNNYRITYETIQRTNSFHDNILDEDIVSASNIRKRINDNESIDKYIPDGVKKYINKINYDTLFAILKLKIITDGNLMQYLDVDNGMNMKLVRTALSSNNYNEFIEKAKNKKYTYTRLNRMITHILLGITKEDVKKEKLKYLHVLGFNKVGQKYLSLNKKRMFISNGTDKFSKIYKYEIRAAALYELITGEVVYKYDNSTKPIKDFEKELED